MIRVLGIRDGVCKGTLVSFNIRDSPSMHCFGWQTQVLESNYNTLKEFIYAHEDLNIGRYI